MARIVRRAAPLAAGAALLLTLVPVRALTVREAGSGQLLYAARVQAGEAVSLEYMHSVDRVPVTGRFRVAADGALTLEETVAPAFGAGLPRLGPGEPYRLTGGLLRSPESVRLTELPLLVHPVARMQLSLRGREVPLAALPGAPARVRVRVERLPALRLLLAS
ncbi:MAG TPA: DUF1850 domain-containing protein [Candidatus Methylomirabilis sp.]|nr:DUF1850 domain-containing protein [Candidatus Methylomirabilis sp.]